MAETLDEAEIAINNIFNAQGRTKSFANTFLDISHAFSSGGFIKGMGALAKGIGSLVAAHPIIASLAAAFAAYKVADKFIFTYDEDLEKAQKALSDYQSTQQEIESVNNELSTTSARMDELLAKDSLTLVEKDELAKLQRSNDELERRAKILDIQETMRYYS